MRVDHAFAWLEHHTTRTALDGTCAFALLARLALHDKRSADAPFLDGLTLAEHDAIDRVPLPEEIQ